MKRHLEMLLALALLGLSMAMATAAQAAPTFNWQSGTTKLTMSAGALQRITTTAGSLECNEVSGEIDVSKLTTGQTSVTLANIVYKNSGEAKCSLAPFGKTEVKMNGCAYVFNLGNEVPGVEDKTSGTAKITCPEKASIEFIAPSGACTIKIGPQEGLGPVTYEGNTAASPKDIVIQPSISNLSYTHEGASCGKGSASNGTYTGTITVKGENAAGTATGTWVGEPPPPASPKGFNWDSGTTKLTLSATSAQKFTTTAGTLECNEISGEIDVSKLSTGQTSLTSTNVIYKNSGGKCLFEPFGSLEFQMNGCSYRFNAGETSGGNDKTLGTTDIVCPEKKVIEIIAPSGACTIKIAPQNGLGPVTYEDNTAASPKDVLINPAISNISYAHSGFFCGTGSGTNGTMSGSITMKGEDGSGVGKGVWVA